MRPHGEAEVRARFDALDTEAAGVRNGARLFSRIAIVLHELEGLRAAARAHRARRRSPPATLTTAFVRLIAGLLAVVFEAADSAGDPEISRALVAMFNFMQGKEFAGQERALRRRRLRLGPASMRASRHQLAAPDRVAAGCLAGVRRLFRSRRAGRRRRPASDAAVLAELERLRRIGLTFQARRRGSTPA